MSHDHSHHSHGILSTTNFAFALAVILNVSFTLIEAIYAIYANSTSLLADAGHNLGDVLGLILAWGANWLLTKPASERYSYGYRRTTILAAVINALLLVATSVLIAYEAIEKLSQPQPINEWIVIIVAFIGIIINGGTALLFLRDSKSDLNIKGAFLHLATDALISVGVVLSALIIMWTKWLILDSIVGLIIVLIILYGTWGLLKDSINLMLDSVPSHINQQGVAEYFKALPHVTDLHDLHIWGLSTREVALTVHLVMPNHTLTDEQYHTINHDLKEKFYIDHVTIQVEQGSLEHPCHLEGIC